MNLQEIKYMMSLSVLTTDLKLTQNIRGILLAAFPNNDDLLNVQISDMGLQQPCLDLCIF